ncbi:LURP-one-related/scramblase family protein [Lacrimispora aerotolerans]|uniref:LURP-one-related/scramblase family protein n=1 Tax=Lacrimispora aerotolerans TaxID=36832 RepID=UPI0004795D13|nr:LURP-one-related family protein [Lacrimispora aerotolerans]
MKLMFKQRFFSWFDSYDIYDESGNAIYTVKGMPAWGHKLQIYDRYDNHLATLREHIISFLPCFDIQVNGQTIGTIRKEFTFFKPSFSVDCKGWRVEGSFFEWDYQIMSSTGKTVAVIEKQLFHFTDTYIIDVPDMEDSLLALMVVLAIDAVKCSESN